MTDFNDDEIDKGFRRVIEGKSIMPPSSLWADIRISALERQLVRYQAATIWFKGAIGVLAALLGGAGYLLYKAKNAPPRLQKEVVTLTKLDTVYLTRTEKVYVDRPVVVYAENSRPATNAITPDLNQSGFNNEAAIAETEGENKPISSALWGKKSKRSKQEISKENGRFRSSDSRVFSGKMRQNYSGKDPINITENRMPLNQSGLSESIENVDDDFLGKENVTVRQLDAVESLESLPIKLNSSLATSKINFNPVPKIIVNLPKPKKPFIDRFSISAYLMPKWNSIDVRRGEPNAFKYGNEELEPGASVGLRAGVKLSKRWSVLAGIEFEGTRFGDGNNRQTLTAEQINGTFGYLYRTALGTVEIPDEELSTQAQAGSVVGLQIHESIQRYVLNLPLAMRYDVWNKRFKFMQQVPMKVQFYGLLGWYWQIPLLQEGSVEIFESTGRKLTGELTKFQNLHSSCGVNVSIGTDLGIGKRFHVFAEPTYTQGISSVVRDMPLRSVTNSFGIKVGTKWSFKK